MNGSGKQSFYEIQLSNSSLIVAFLVAVGLGVAVFMLGVMVGRGQAPETPTDGGFLESFPAEGTAEEVPAGDPEFFSKVQEPLEDGTDTAPPAGQPAASSPAATGAADDRAAPGRLDLPAHDPALASGFVVQVKATPNRGQADALQSSLAEVGFPAFVVSAEVNGATTYRVRVGRYRDRSAAERVAGLLSQRGDIDATWITQG